MAVMLLEWVFTAVFLILAVLALRAAFGKRVSARLRYALWAVVLVRLLVPVQLFTSPIAGTWIFSEITTEEAVDSRPAVPTAPPAPTVPPAPVSGLPVKDVGQGDGLTLPDVPAFPDAPALPDAPEAPDVPAAPDLREPPDWMGYLAWAWLAGAGAAALVLLLSNLHFYGRLRRCRIPLEGTGCPLPVYVAVGLPSPCLFGLLRPAVYVSPGTAENPAMLRHVLAHELTHFRHGDHLWNVLRCAALAVHWWNPLVWLAVVLSRRDGELACDEGALKRLGDGERLAYGNTLIALVTARPQPGDLFSFATTMAGDKKSLRERIARIAGAPRRWLWAAAAMVLATALACLCAFGQAEKPPAAGKDPVELPPADLEFTLETAEDGTPFVRIQGQVDGRTVDHTSWNPEGDGFGFGALADIPGEGEKQGPRLSAEYEFSTGWASMSARWADEERTSVTVSTAMSATLSSYSNSGYWVFTVELSGESGTVVSKEHSKGNANMGEQKLYPASLPDEDAVQAARYAAKLLTAAEDYYNNATAGRGAEVTFDWDGSPAMLVNGTNLAIGTDLNRNGVPETITAGRLCAPDSADEARTSTDDSRWDLVVVVQEDGEVLWYGFASQIHAGENAILLYTKDGQHYLMEFDIHGGMGHGNGYYRVFTLENGTEHTVRENQVEFDYCWTGAGADVRENFDPEAVAAFVEDADSVLADCVVLADTSGDFWPDQPLRVDLRWLSNYAFGFQWNAQLTTLENLTRFKLAGEAPAYAGDLDRDMRKELIQRTIITDEEGGAQGQRVEIWRDETLVWSEDAYYVHAGYNAIFLCTLDGKDYLLRYNPAMGQGSGMYSYKLFTLSPSGEERTVKENRVEFDTNFWGSEPLHGQFEPNAINAFLTEINELLAHSVVLINTDDDLISSFESFGGRLYHVPLWLRTCDPVFTYDPDKALVDNLWAFRRAMQEANYADRPEVRSLDENGRHMQLTYGGRYVQFDGLWDEMRQPEVEPQVLDLNGDGRDEIAFVLLEGAGTGVAVERLYIFDADTLKQYDTAGLTDRIIAQIDAAGDDKEYFYLSAPGMERAPVPKSAAYRPGERVTFGNIVYYAIQDGRLLCWLGCDVGMLEYSGNVLVTLAMDRQGEVVPVSYEYVPGQIPADPPAVKAGALYREVLLGEAGFRLMAGERELYEMKVGDLPGYCALSDNSAVTWFAVADLDADGGQEVVLQVDGVSNEFSTFVVLYEKDGTVYGRACGWRTFGTLKQDGTFAYATQIGVENGRVFTLNGEPMEDGVAALNLATGELSRKLYGTMDTPTNRAYSACYVEGQKVSRKAFEAAKTDWEGQPDAGWFAFTPENIREVFP